MAAQQANSSAPRKKRRASEKGNGKNRRTPQQLERQAKVFDRNVMFGRTIRQLAVEFKISQKTVMSDLRHEESLRADELGAQREAARARSIAFYDGVIAKAHKKSELYDTLLDERIGAKVTDHTLDAMIKAQERKDKLQGLDAPIKLDAGIDKLVEALISRDDA